MIVLLNSIIPLLSAAAVAFQPLAMNESSFVPLPTASAPAAAPPAAPQPPAQDAQVLPPDAPPPIAPEVDALLTKLEHAADDLQAFTADVLLVKYDPVMNRPEHTRGSVIYQVQAPADELAAPRKRFSIRFDTLQEGSRRQAINQQFIFDGAWLVEIDADRRQFFKRQIVAEGETFDPLKLGEGPFPLPLGQPKADVLARFEVQLLGPPEELPLRGLENVEGVRLVPKPGSKEADEFQHVDVYYDRDLRLPVGIETVSARQLDPADPTSRERRSVRLSKLQRNPQLTPEQLQALTTDVKPPEGWVVEVTPWHGR